MPKLRVLSLFSGIGGFDLGLERTGGFETVAFCESDTFCQQVLAKHWPSVPCHDDVCTMEFTIGQADVVVGGFPCQDISVAGKRAGLSGARSGLYWELVRAIRVVRPLYAILENVAELLRNGMGVVLGDLAESGYSVEWDCVPACALGACHERDRVWIVAHDNQREQQIGRTQPVRWGQCGPSEGACSRVDTDAIDAERRSFSSSCNGLAGLVSIPQGQEGSGGFESASEQIRIADDAHAPIIGRGQGRTGRPPDSFTRIRDEARRNAADPYGARLAFGQSVARDTHEELSPAERDIERSGTESIWPNEPALLGMDDGVSNWVDRTKALGNALVPQIPELIGRAILAASADG